MAVAPTDKNSLNFYKIRRKSTGGFKLFGWLAAAAWADSKGYKMGKDGATSMPDKNSTAPVISSKWTSGALQRGI